MRWPDFYFAGTRYSLSHLDDLEVTYVQSASGNKPERTHEVKIEFSNHCFTTAGAYDAALEYLPAKDKRIFEFKRYELSKSLPSIIRDLANRNCYFASSVQGNFMTCEVTVDKENYVVYFYVKKFGKKLVLIVQSAYVNDDYTRSHKDKKVGFFLILNKTQRREPIKRPQ